MSPNEEALSALAQDQAAGQGVADGTLAGSQADVETVEHKIVAAENGDMRKESAPSLW
ncbi:MAG: hypothetical protein WBR10_12385 [Candidatus Acidiferrum sp.]